MANTTKPTLPNYVCPERVALDADLQLIDDLLGGSRAMWAASAKRHYIRKWSDEDQSVYDMRRQCETLFGGFERTLAAAAGMLFRTPPAITWNAGEALMTPQLDNIDGAGTAFDVFAKRFTESAMEAGLGVILVDHPSRPKDAAGNPVLVTAENEAALNLRPMWAQYEREHILSWQVGTLNNRKLVTQIVFAEEHTEPSGFGTRCVPRFRVLRLLNGLATWSLYEQIDERGDDEAHFRLVGSGTFRNRAGKVLTGRLPIAIAYTGRTDAPMAAEMPLLPVAFANLSHWQIATNLRFNREVAAYEQPVVTGDLAQGQNADGSPTAGKMRLGPLVVVQLQAGGTFQWASPSGAGLEQLAKGKEEKLVEMGQLGLSFLTPDRKAQETATAHRLDKVAEHATVATAGRGAADALNEALELHAWFLGIEKASAPVVTLSTDFEASGPDAPIMNAFAALAKVGFPKRPLLEAMQRMEVIAADAKLDDLEQDWIAGEQAANDQASLDAAARGALQGAMPAAA